MSVQTRRLPSTATAPLGWANAGAALLALGVWRLVGGDGGTCGSPLSRVDEHGDYAVDKPASCAPYYSEAHRDAWFGGTVVAAALGAVTLSDRRPESTA